MTHRARWVGSAIAIVAALTIFSNVAYGQGSMFTTLTGTVVDNTGGVLPGADVKVKNNGTGEEVNAVTTAAGTFSVPSLPGGTYSVTVSLIGFKTVVLQSVTLNVGIPASVKVTLDVGALEENVTVVGESASIVQTATPAIAINISGKQILALPLASRNALESLTSLPGFNTAANNPRSSTVSGLPRAALNITFDGMSVQDNYNKESDGYYARLNPRLDAVEEVTVTTAGGTVDGSQGGAIQIKFVTRSGTNTFTGSAYEYYRNDKFNSNTWFNNRDLAPGPNGKAPKPVVRLHQPGGRVGGPIIIPGVWNGRDKGFFFVNVEVSKQPSYSTVNRTMLTPASTNGIFAYTVGGQVRTVNLYELAAANGQLTTPDPTILKILTAINDSTSKSASGSISSSGNAATQRYTFQVPGKNFTPYPTGRVDFNLTRKHRLTGSVNYQHVNDDPDLTNNGQEPFPGFLSFRGSQQSSRYSTSNSLRSTISTNMVNELRVGGTGGATLFSPEIQKASFTGGTPDMGGYAYNLNGGLSLTNPYARQTSSSREAYTRVVEDTLNWNKGNHSFAFGFNMVQAAVWLDNYMNAPLVNFGVVTGDPAEGMFTPANFQGASTTDLANARFLYALLTGRVSSVSAEARLNEAGDAYEVLGLSHAAGRLREFDFFGQDSWRLKSNLTLTLGLRYVMQGPFYPTNNSYTKVTMEDIWGVSGVGNLFKPGTLTGRSAATPYVQYPKGEYAYHADRNNFGPALGATWAPGQRSGFLGRILGGDGDSVFRAAMSTSYDRTGMDVFSGTFGSNQGIAVTRNRDLANNNLGALPQLVRNPGSLALPSFPTAPSYPVAATVSNSVNMFDPDIQLSHAMTWTAGYQRKITRNTAVEARYVRSRHTGLWETYNYNETNIVENGFLQEFRVAQANLQANIAAGRGATFRYAGPGTGTSPLPIALAYFSGLGGAANYNDATKYTSSNFGNTAFVNTLAMFNPNPYTFANNLWSNATFRGQALNAGLPSNFFVANPEVSAANVRDNAGGHTSAQSVQVEFRKRLSNGIAGSLSYTWGQAFDMTRYSLRTPLRKTVTVGADGDVTHAYKGNWVFELPFGRDRRWASNASPLLERIIGGWEFDGVGRVQTGQRLDFGNVRLNGMTEKEFQKAYKIRFAQNGQVYMLPQDIIDNTIKAFSVSATDPSGYSQGVPTGRYLSPANGPNCIEVAVGTTANTTGTSAGANPNNLGYGDCGVGSLVITGPKLVTFDMSVVKRTRIAGSTSFEFRAEMLNAFNHPFFLPVAQASPTETNYRVTSGTSARLVQLVFRLLF